MGSVISLEFNFSEVLFTRREELVLEGCDVIAEGFAASLLAIGVLDLATGALTLLGGVGTLPLLGMVRRPVLLLRALLLRALLLLVVGTGGKLGTDGIGAEERGVAVVDLGVVRGMELPPVPAELLSGVGVWA